MAKILIIEDDGELQQLLSVALFHDGYDLHYAFNGKEGHDKILSLRPDLILLDLMLPILSGLDVLKLAAANAVLRNIPVIVMTAHGDNSEMIEEKVKSYGAREYVRKPFDLNDLAGRIARLLAQCPAQPQATPAQILRGVMRLDPRLRTVWISDKLVATLSATKAQVFKILLEAQGPVKREKLLQDVWGGAQHVSALEKTIQRLREDLGPESKRLQTTPDGYEIIV